METLEWNQKQKELFNLYFKNHEGITIEEIMNNMRNYSQIWQDFYRFLINSSLEFNMFDSIDEIKKIKFNNINYLIIKIGLFGYLCIDLDKKEAINYNDSLKPFNEEFFIKHFDEHKMEKPEDFYYYLDMNKKDVNELIEYIDNNDILLEKNSFIHKIDIYNHTTFLLFNVTKQTGYTETIFGRRRYMPEINSSNGALRQFAERTAKNAPIQGAAADVIKIAMIAVDNKFKELGLQSKLIAQVHDELVVDTKNDEIDTVKKILKEVMENVVKLDVLLEAELSWGDNWDMK